MKKTAFLLSMMIVTTVAFSNGIRKGHQVHVLSVRLSVAHLKLSREFVGATLEIYSENGELILSQVVHERKVLIDFDNQKEGIYKIKIKKGEEQAEINYTNAHSSFLENEYSEPITIVQGI
jgi:hypothetical protein